MSTRPLLGEEGSGEEGSGEEGSGEEGSGEEASPELAPLLAVRCYLPFALYTRLH